VFSWGTHNCRQVLVAPEGLYNILYPEMFTRVTGHNPPGQNIRSVARLDKTQNHTSPTWKLNFGIGRRKPPGSEPPIRGFWTRGLCPQILKFSFQNPLSCNRKQHRTLCSNSTGRYVLGVSSGLATDRGVLTRGVMSRGFMSANHSRGIKVRDQDVWRLSRERPRC